jgi:hypothetical protein
MPSVLLAPNAIMTETKIRGGGARARRVEPDVDRDRVPRGRLGDPVA